MLPLPLPLVLVRGQQRRRRSPTPIPSCHTRCRRRHVLLLLFLLLLLQLQLLLLHPQPHPSDQGRKDAPDLVRPVPFPQRRQVLVLVQGLLPDAPPDDGVEPGKDGVGEQARVLLWGAGLAGAVAVGGFG